MRTILDMSSLTSEAEAQRRKVIRDRFVQAYFEHSRTGRRHQISSEVRGVFLLLLGAALATYFNAHQMK